MNSLTRTPQSPQEGPQRITRQNLTRAQSSAKPGHAWQARKAGNAMTTQQMGLEFYAPPPDPTGYTWRAFTLDTPEEQAAAAFLRRYGRPPEFVFESRGNLLCGPIPEVTP